MAYNFKQALQSGMSPDTIKAYLASKGRSKEADDYFASNPNTPAKPISLATPAAATPTPVTPPADDPTDLSAQGHPILNFLGDLTGTKKLGVGIGRAIYNISGEADKNRQAILDMSKNNDAIIKMIHDPATSPERKAKLTALLQSQADQQRQLLADEEQNSTGGLTNKEVIGSAIQTAANFLPVAKIKGLATGNKIVNVASKVAGKSAAGAATGYAYDVGANLQNNESGGDVFKPGIGTAFGAAGSLLASSLGGIKGALTKGLDPEKTAAKLREINLRLTPTQKRDIQVYGPQVWGELKGLKGSPAQQLETMTERYHAMEDTVQEALKKSKVEFDKTSIIEGISALKNDAELSSDITASHTFEKHIDQVVANLGKKFPGDTIPATELNVVKRAVTKGARNKAGLEVTDAVDAKIGDLLTDALHGKFKDSAGIYQGGVPELEKLNAKYRGIINARKLLRLASGRSEVGVIGKLVSSAAASHLGSILGPVGTAAGSVAGPAIAEKVAGTGARSAVAGTLEHFSNWAKANPAIIKTLQTATSPGKTAFKPGNISIPQNVMLDLLEYIRSNQ